MQEKDGHYSIQLGISSIRLKHAIYVTTIITFTFMYDQHLTVYKIYVKQASSFIKR